ncbi:hypothetical protein HPB47_014247 [Ixodes persulcatus]|uniref:Uncharacterized protein n=1 Tax=Ixodes persulcatus TaxID=34615 RepID=A0AC60QWE6_IXOPE|nr:hypothetical protein HPB47_014247 [Ixodes persulcatus]
MASQESAGTKGASTAPPASPLSNNPPEPAAQGPSAEAPEEKRAISVTLANLTMEAIERKFLDTFDPKPRTFLRYVDNCFCVVKTSEVDRLLKHLNSDRSPKERAQVLVYRIPCKDCPASYVGESKNFAERLTRHKYYVRKNDVETSALAEHAEAAGHTVDFEGSTLLALERNRPKRLFVESWFIQHTKGNVNPSSGSLPSSYVSGRRDVSKAPYIQRSSPVDHGEPAASTDSDDSDSEPENHFNSHDDDEPAFPSKGPQCKSDSKLVVKVATTLFLGRLSGPCVKLTTRIGTSRFSPTETKQPAAFRPLDRPSSGSNSSTAPTSTSEDRTKTQIRSDIAGTIVFSVTLAYTARSVMFCVSSWLYSGGFDNGIPACLPPPPRRAISRTATAGAPPEFGVGCPASPRSRNGLQVRVQTLWLTGRTHWQTGGFGMLVTSTSWNWGEGEDELLKEDTVAGGGRVEESRRKEAGRTGEEHRHAGRQESAEFWRRTLRTQGRWRGDPARGKTTQESESLRRRKKDTA